MSFTDSLNKAAEAVAGLSVVEQVVDKPYLEALAQALRELASLSSSTSSETGGLVMANDLATKLEEQLAAAKQSNELLFLLLKELNEAKEASWQ